MNLLEAGRIAGVLGTALTFFVGGTSVVLGLVDSSPEQSGISLIVRGFVLVGLSLVAGYGASQGIRRPSYAAILYVAVAVLGSIVAFRSFFIADVVLLIAAAISYSSRDK